MGTPSERQVLEAVADRKSLDLFCSVATGTVERTMLKQETGLTRKQYYLRTARMSKAGLVKRKNSRFKLTAFGVIVYHAILEIESAIKNHWKLKAIDSIQASNVMTGEERAKIVKSVIDDKTIEDILVKMATNQ